MQPRDVSHAGEMVTASTLIRRPTLSRPACQMGVCIPLKHQWKRTAACCKPGMAAPPLFLSDCCCRVSAPARRIHGPVSTQMVFLGKWSSMQKPGDTINVICEPGSEHAPQICLHCIQQEAVVTHGSMAVESTFQGNKSGATAPGYYRALAPVRPV